MKKILTLIVCLSAIMASWAAKAPTDEQLKALCRDAGVAMQTATNDAERKAAFDAVAAKLEKQTDISKITVAQVDMLFEFGGLTLDRELRLWLEPTLNNRAASDAVFAFLAWKLLPENDGFSHNPKETAAFVRFVSSKDLQKAITAKPDLVTDVFNAMTTMKDANWHSDGFAEGMVSLMECKLPETPLLECVKVFNSAARVDNFDEGKGFTAAVREKLRTLCLNHYKTLASTLESARKKKICNEHIAYLEGPFACGTLVGGKAPELHLIRVYKQEGDEVVTKEIKSLNELQGKVILLDFWGTKCVPCIKSFPEIAEIQQHFEGKDVVILGVTSLQGYFVDVPNNRTIQCRNDAEKELSLFPGFMKAMGMTWTVAISEEDVMNTDYGALAIPHVVLIDKKGIVRYNALNVEKDEKIKLVEELLAQ